MQQLLFALMAALLLFVPASARADEDWQINNFQSQIVIQEDGRVHVTETIDTNFPSPKHGIFRDMPLTYQGNDGTRVGSEIKITSVSEQYQEERNSNNLRLKIGNPNQTITGPHHYQIEYLVSGVLRNYGSYDELYWNVTGNDWPVAIDKASATVTLPQAGIIQTSCYRGSLGSTDSCQGTTEQDRTASFSTNALPAGEGMTVAVGYSAGLVPILIVAPPLTGLASVLTSQFWLGFGVTLIVGLLICFAVWWRWGRDSWLVRKSLHDPNVTEGNVGIGAYETIVPEYESPERLRPAEIGVLIDEQADTKDITATIIDLAVRGYLTITEEPKKWLFGSNDYVLKRTSKTDKGLLGYEQLLLTSLFENQPEVRLSALKEKFYTKLAAVKTALYEEVAAKQLFDGNPEKIRTKAVAIMVVIFVVISFLEQFFFVHDNSTLNHVMLGVFLAEIPIALVGFILAYTMPRRTAKGRELLRRTKGYQMFVSGTEKYRQPFFENKNIFMDVLPYAMVFGVTQKLVSAFKDMGITPPNPGWYVGSHPFTPTAFASDINSFSESLSSAIASAPSSSGSGGGGFSGGGFGGGGGGSW